MITIIVGILHILSPFHFSFVRNSKAVSKIWLLTNYTTEVLHSWTEYILENNTISYLYMSSQLDSSGMTSFQSSWTSWLKNVICLATEKAITYFIKSNSTFMNFTKLRSYVCVSTIYTMFFWFLGRVPNLAGQTPPEHFVFIQNGY